MSNVVAVKKHTLFPALFVLIFVFSLFAGIAAFTGKVLLFSTVVAGICLLAWAYLAPSHALAAAVFLLTVCPVQLYFEISSALPIITIQRVVIGLMMAATIVRRAVMKDEKAYGRIPFLNFLIALLLLDAMSLVRSPFLHRSILNYLGTVFQVVLFYLIIFINLKNENDCYRVFFVMVVAMSVISALGIIERETGWSIVSYLPVPSREILHYQSPASLGGWRVRPIVTFPHSILLGVGIVMAWPFSLIIATHARFARWQRVVCWAVQPLLGLCLYYTDSRGPWLAGTLAFLLIFAGASRKLRRTLLILALFGLISLGTRHGVVPSVARRVKATMDISHPYGSSFWYRLELARVGVRAVSGSAYRALLGFGPGTFLLLQLKGDFRGEPHLYWSSDSDYVLCLVEGGILGLAARLCLFGAVIVFLGRKYSAATGIRRDTFLASLASLTAFLLAIMSVSAFRAQTGSLFWIVVATSAAFARFGPAD